MVKNEPSVTGLPDLNISNGYQQVILNHLLNSTGANSTGLANTQKSKADQEKILFNTQLISMVQSIYQNLNTFRDEMNDRISTMLHKFQTNVPKPQPMPLVNTQNYEMTLAQAIQKAQNIQSQEENKIQFQADKNTMEAQIEVIQNQSTQNIQQIIGNLSQNQMNQTTEANAILSNILQNNIYQSNIAQQQNLGQT